MRAELGRSLGGDSIGLQIVGEHAHMYIYIYMCITHAKTTLGKEG